MDNDQDPAQSIHTERYVARLFLRVGILDGYRKGISKGLLGVREADLVLGQVGLGFGRIELDVHLLSMHTSCILSRPRRRAERSESTNVPVQRRAAQRTVRCNRLLCRAAWDIGLVLLRESIVECSDLFDSLVVTQARDVESQANVDVTP